MTSAVFACLATFVSCAPLQPGVWGWTCDAAQHPIDQDSAECFEQMLERPPSTVRGWFMKFYWDEVEPSPGKYDWSAFDANLTKAAHHGLQVQPAIWIYQASHKLPAWLKQFSAPVKYHKGSKDGPLFDAPNYKDTAFQDRWQQLIRAFALHIGELPAKLQKDIWAVQVVCGITGDNRPWNGVAAQKSDDLTADEWIAYTHKIANTYINAFQPFDIGVIANLRKGPYAQEDNGWFLQRAATKGLQNRAVKEEQGTMLAQLNGEGTVYTNDSPLLLQKQSDGVFAHGRGEMTSSAAWDKVPFWNLQATAEWALTYGIDVWNLATPFTGNSSFSSTLEFFNRHAGQKEPATATAAFISFRDALDTLDTHRWPVSKYGEVDSSTKGQCNKKRMQMIAADNSKRGASLGTDDGYSYKAEYAQKKSTCVYDVGYDIFQQQSPHGYGNYGQHIKQLDPLGTSVGWWQLGPVHQPYGRFARGLEHASHKSTITLELDSHFSVKGQAAKVQVVYFDKGTGRWSLTLETAAGQDRVLTVHKGDSKKWKVAEVDITLGSNSQLILFSPDQEDVVFSLVEVLKTSSTDLIV